MTSVLRKKSIVYSGVQTFDNLWNILFGVKLMLIWIKSEKCFSDLVITIKIIHKSSWSNISIDIELPSIIRMERQAGGVEAINKATELLSNAKFPVILSGAGVVLANAIEDCVKLAE